jgi:hypothetical protein
VDLVPEHRVGTGVGRVTGRVLVTRTRGVTVVAGAEPAATGRGTGTGAGALLRTGGAVVAGAAARGGPTAGIVEASRSVW